jgi:hypothetical protein
MRNSANYLMTLNPNSETDMQKLSDLRNRVKLINYNNLIKESYNPNLGKVRVRVSVRPRLGRNNPAASLYSRQYIRSILLKHAQRLDVYVSERKVW